MRGQEDKKNVHTFNWKEIFKPTKHCGLGISESDSNNKVMLAKKCWKYLSNPDLLSTQILKVKRCPNKSLWEVVTKKGGHHFRRDMWGY